MREHAGVIAEQAEALASESSSHTKSEPDDAPTAVRPDIFGTAEKCFVYLVVVAVLVAFHLALSGMAADVRTTYDAGLTLAVQRQESSVLFALAGAKSIVGFKVLALYVAALIVALGTLFVLKGVEANYQLRAEKAGTGAALETSSPGLVMITLGIGLVLSLVWPSAHVSASGASAKAPDAPRGTTQAQNAAVEDEAARLIHKGRVAAPPTDTEGSTSK